MVTTTLELETYPEGRVSHLKAPEDATALRSSLPLEPAITTWKSSRFSPLLVALVSLIGVLHHAHLMLVVLGGLGQPSVAFGFSVGFLSKKVLKATQFSMASQIMAHSVTL